MAAGNLMGYSNPGARAAHLEDLFIFLGVSDASLGHPLSSGERVAPQALHRLIALGLQRQQRLNLATKLAFLRRR